MVAVQRCGHGTFTCIAGSALGGGGGGGVVGLPLSDMLLDKCTQ